MSVEFSKALSQGLRAGTNIPSLNNVAGATIMGWIFNKTLPVGVNKYTLTGTSVGPPPGVTPNSRLEIELKNDPGGGVIAQYTIVSRALDGDADSIDGSPDNSGIVGFAQHVVATCDFNTRQVKLYVNGVLINTGTAGSMTAGNTSATNGKAASIGCEEDALDEFADSFIEDVRHYNRVLSADEIQTIYECQGVDGIVFGLQQRYELQAGFDGQSVSEISPQDSAQQMLNASVPTASSPLYRNSIAPTFRRRLP